MSHRDHAPTTPTVRQAHAGDEDAVWAILRPILEAGETYALPRDMGRADALAFWMGPPHEAFVAEIDGAPAGISYVCANRPGGGAHVANAGFATGTGFAGRGVARTLCAAALEHARARGFRAMQFNFVVASNTRAVALWHAMGFATVGRVPAAFDHPRLGEVDALVMHRFLDGRPASPSTD